MADEYVVFGEEEILRLACALPLPPDDGELEEGSSQCASFTEDLLIFEDKTEICTACEIVLNSPLYGPLCDECHGFLYPDYTIKQRQLDEEKQQRTEQGWAVCSRNSAVSTSDAHEIRGNVANKNDNIEQDFVGLAILSLYDEDFKEEHDISFTSEESFIEDDIVATLPNEIILEIFSYLDEVGLTKAAQVCRRWEILSDNAENWCIWFEKKWPSFRPLGLIDSWMTLYIKMLNSSTCLPCLEQGFVKHIPVDDLPNPWRNKRLRSELKQLLLDAPEGIRACPVDDDYSHWQASIEGPPNSVYEYGIFYVHLELPRSYPMRPPLVRFLTKILHPNISRHGNIGMDCLLNNWSLALTIPKILISIQSILTDPYCVIYMEETLAKLYTQDRAKFDQMARNWTAKYAMHHLQNDLSDV